MTNLNEIIELDDDCSYLLVKYDYSGSWNIVQFECEEDMLEALITSDRPCFPALRLKLSVKGLGDD